MALFYFVFSIVGLDFVSFHALDSDLAAVGLDLVSFASIYSKVNSLKLYGFFSLRVWQNGLGPSWTMLYILCTCLQLIVLYLRKFRTGTNCNLYSPSCSFIYIDICVECTCADPGARTHKSLTIMFFPNNLSEVDKKINPLLPTPNSKKKKKLKCTR